MLEQSSARVESPAFARFSALPRPFLRWAGSKQALLPNLIDAIPTSFGRYYEPFLGSGALFFHLKPKDAYLTDVSSELIGLWTAVRDHPTDLLEYLLPLKPDKELYYKIRANRSDNSIIRAAEFLYLNKTCWNGLYRVNSKGQFNVPFGRPRSDFIVDERNLLSCSALLQHSNVNIGVSDFESSVASAKAGDLVYLDPPYVTKHNNNGFRDYNEKLFSWDDQIRLADLARRLRQRDVYVVISNANHKSVLDLYSDFHVTMIERYSTLSSRKQFRGMVSEVVITSQQVT